MIDIIRSIKIHSLIYSTTAIIIGFQIVAFSMFTKAFASSEGLIPEDIRLIRLLRYFSLEKGIIIGFLILLLGVAGSIYALKIWESSFFRGLNPSETMKIVIPSVTCLALGCQVIFSSFFLSVIGLKRR